MPPFEELLARNPQGSSRTPGAAGAAVLGVTVAVVGVVVVTSSLLAEGENRGERTASPTTTHRADAPGVDEYRYALKFADADAYEPSQDAAVGECLQLPGTHDAFVNFSLPPQYGVLVRGTAQIRLFDECVDAVDNVVVTREPS